MLKTIALAVLGIATAAAAPSPALWDPQKDIVDTAVAAGSFKTPASALQAAGLVETLKGQGAFTVFAPTDEAFAKLPAGTLENLLKPEHRDDFRRILTYHVVTGRVMSNDVVKLHSAEAVSGDSITIRVSNRAVMVNVVRVLTPDVDASNGVIHVIDPVILSSGR